MYIINYNNYTLEVEENRRTIDLFDGISRYDIRRSSDVRTGASGGNIWELQRGMRVLTIGGALMATDLTEYYDMRTDMERAFDIVVDSDLMTITRPDGASKQIHAKVIEIPQFTEEPGDYAVCAYNIVLMCEDPLFEAGEQSGTISPGTLGGAPLATPLPAPLGGVTETLIIVNDGDKEIYPNFVITGVIENPVVYNQTTGESFAIANTIAVGETLEVYQNNEGIFVVNNGANWYQFWSGTYFALRVGSNVITFNGSAFDGNASLTVSFTKKYLSL